MRRGEAREVRTTQGSGTHPRGTRASVGELYLYHEAPRRPGTQRDPGPERQRGQGRVRPVRCEVTRGRRGAGYRRGASCVLCGCAQRPCPKRALSLCWAALRPRHAHPACAWHLSFASARHCVCASGLVIRFCVRSVSGGVVSIHVGLGLGLGLGVFVHLTRPAGLGARCCRASAAAAADPDKVD